MSNWLKGLGVVLLSSAVSIAALKFLEPSNAQTSPTLRLVPLGFCSLSSMSSATLISTCSPYPTSAAYAVICAYTQGVNWRDDGTAPTGTTGTGGQTISAGQCLGYNGTLSAFQAIQLTSGAILGISFYR
jgi:hypothetical protein